MSASEKVHPRTGNAQRATSWTVAVGLKFNAVESAQPGRAQLPSSASASAAKLVACVSVQPVCG